MKLDSKTLLNARLRELNCEQVPGWLQTRLLPLVQSEINTATTKIERQIVRNIARVVTTKTIAAAFIQGPKAQGETGNGEGSKGEATPPLLPTGNAEH